MHTTIISNQFTQRHWLWTTFKQLLVVRNTALQYEELSQQYRLWFYDGPEIHICEIWYGVVPEDVVAAGLSQEQNAIALSEFTTSFKPFANVAIEKRDSSGSRINIFEKADFRKATIVTHDWCDKTTWYTDAVRVVNEQPAAVVAGTSYQLAHTHIIDTYHGKLVQEDFLLDSSGNSYRISVTVDGVPKTEVDPHTGVGDYLVEYTLGTIYFTPAISVLADVRVTYHYATSSSFYIKPEAGYILSIDVVEAQFSDNTLLTDTTFFQLQGLVDVFAPQLMPGIPSGTFISVGNPLVYKTFKDYVCDAIKSYPSHPAYGVGNWRSSNRPYHIFCWDYITSTKLKSSYGMRIKIKLEHDVPFSGDSAAVTFYCSLRLEG